MKVCVVGLGQIGFPVAQYTSEKGLHVWGYDINPVTVENADKSGTFKATTNWDNIPQTDVYIICVTTGQKNGDPDLSAVFDVAKNIAQKTRTNPNTLITIESTILPGTSKRIFTETFQGKGYLVHAPHRYWTDQPEKYGVNQLRVIGGVNTESLNVGFKFYEEDLGIPMHKVSSVEIAEMCKITENSHRYLQIAFAEDLKMLCSKVGMDFNELRAAMNTKWNVDLPQALEGIGRHCLPKDIQYVTTIAPNASSLLECAIQVDKKYREWLAQQQNKSALT